MPHLARKDVVSGHVRQHSDDSSTLSFPGSYVETPNFIGSLSVLVRLALAAAMLQVLVSAWVCALLLLATVLTS